MKLCSKCKNRKPKKDFNKCRSKSDGLHMYCRNCMKEYQRKYYRKNRQIYSENSLKRRSELRKIYREIKGVPCMDCGKEYPWWLMDFDHRPDEDKLYVVSLMITRKVSKEKMIEEIKKCDVVCALCHRNRTHWRLLGRVEIPPVEETSQL